jgi:hypothetical protein
MTDIRTREKALTRAKLLKDSRSKGWDGHWRSVSDNLLPRQSRFLTTDRDRGGDRNQNIIDSTGTRANRVLSAGMMAGMTSPARPWFQLATPDPALNDYHEVKAWTSDVRRILLRIFAKSNTYNMLHGMYRELGGFGTGCSVLMDNYDRVIHHNPMTVGEYSLGINHEGFVDKVAREFELTVEQAAGQFGKQNLSASHRSALDTGNYNSKVKVLHVIEPNADRDPAYKDAKGKPFKSCYWDMANEDTNHGLLGEGGHSFFRALCPRWDVLWGDTYGVSPGMEALGDLLQLQHDQLRKGKAIDYQTDPPLQVPLALKGSDADFLPGGISYYDGNTGSQGVRAAFQVTLDPSVLLEDIRDVRERINSAFYADMFLMIAQADKGMTATEVAERHEEKLLMLGPVLDRLHTELLEPLVSNTFNRAMETGILPPPPEALGDMPMQVEFVSMLAQAQKAISVNAVDRWMGHMGMIAQATGDTSVFDKFDGDKSAERYADQLGVDPDLVVPDDKVAAIREQRAQLVAQQQQAAAMEQMAKSTQALGGVQTGPAASDNAGADLLNLFSGYSSPSSTELQ